MVYPHSKPEVRIRIKPIVIQEYGGIDCLPDKLSELIIYENVISRDNSHLLS